MIRVLGAEGGELGSEVWELLSCGDSSVDDGRGGWIGMVAPVTLNGDNIVEALSASSGLDVLDEALVCPSFEGSPVDPELSDGNGRLDIGHRDDLVHHRHVI